MEIIESSTYKKWYHKLIDVKIKTAILRRLVKIGYDNHFGDFKQLQTNLYELRFFKGSGIRIYYSIFDDKVVIVLVGGDKSSQARDIKKANEILKEFKNE